jgi:hypothetical protein
MDLKGAEVRSFYKITNKMSGSVESIDMVRVPHYQRPYKWGDPREESLNLVAQLIDDWKCENSKNKGAEYFAGSIVTVINESSGCSEHQLIDGQQRFTTIYLTNFLLFLLLRVVLREAINRKQQMSIPTILEGLQKSISYSFNKDINNFLDLEILANAFDDSSSEGNDKLESLLENYCKHIYLPYHSESDSSFEDNYVSNLKECFKKNVLRLSYDRKSYNESLANALSRVIVKCDSQHPLAVVIYKKGLKDGCIELVYLNAIKTIFDTFESISESYPQNDSFKKSLKIIELIVGFLSSIKLCVIQTGNQEDAYTLFEVLNDRSLALDDLDLIKNQFYKCLCISAENTDLPEQELDVEISSREEQWGDRVFKTDSDTNKKLIAYLSTSYITGSKDIGLKTHDEFRNKIKLYLNSYKSKYSKEDLERDFNIFEATKIIVDQFQIKANGRIPNALKAEFSQKTITYKTVHLLLALGYEGVLAGLINYILQYIKQDIKNDKFVLDDIRGFITELADDVSKHSKVHYQAKIIWQITLANKDFKNPKQIANKLIEGNHVRSDKLEDVQGAYNTVETKRWLNSWKYGSNDIKIRVLFSRLIQLSFEKAKLNKAPFGLTISASDIEKLHLDHMEPDKPDETRPNDYYKFGQADRADDINGLGNMFPLYGQHNISKSNAPFKNAFSHLTNSGLHQHWLFLQTQSIFDRNNNNQVPTRDFFRERQEFLIERFIEAINM